MKEIYFAIHCEWYFEASIWTIASQQEKASLQKLCLEAGVMDEDSGLNQAEAPYVT